MNIKHKKAFTLLELILTVVLIGLLAAPVSISIFRNFTKTAVGSVIQDISLLAQKARYISVKYNLPVYMVFDSDNALVSLSWESSRQESVSPEDILGFSSEYALQEDISFSRIAINGIVGVAKPKMIFRPDGSGDYAEIIVDCRGESFEFVLTPLFSNIASVGSNLTQRVFDLDRMELNSNELFK